MGDPWGSIGELWRPRRAQAPFWEPLTLLLWLPKSASQIIPAKHPNSCFNKYPVRTVRTDGPYGRSVRTVRTDGPYGPSVFHRFFKDFGWVGLENVDFPLVFQWFLGCSLSRRVIRLRSGPPAARLRGGFRDPFYHLKNPLAKRY